MAWPISCIATQSNGEKFALSNNARRRHVHLIGQTGSGKTILIKNMIAQHLAAGRGVAVIDPLRLNGRRNCLRSSKESWSGAIGRWKDTGRAVPIKELIRRT